MRRPYPPSPPRGSPALGVEAAVVLVITLAKLEALVRTLRIWLTRPPSGAKEALHLGLACWLAVALELALAVDILRTAIAPGWEAIGQLAAIAALRTLLNYFLQKEIEAAARHGIATGHP